MSHNKPDGGPVYPTYHHDCDIDFGMTVRDWFAGQAMGMTLTAFITRGEGPTSVAELTNLAARSYELADAMIAARSAKPEGE